VKKPSALALLILLVVLGALLLSKPNLLPGEPKYDGQTLSYWMEHWYRNSGGPTVVDPGARAAAREIGTNGLPCFVRWLRTPSRSSAALARTGRNQPAIVIPALLQALTDTVGYTRASTADALASFGPAARDAVAPLRVVLQDPDPYVRTRAAAALKKIAPTRNASDLLPLIQNLRTGNVLVRQQALWALESLGDQRC
jgi:HEAT repeat protein